MAKRPTRNEVAYLATNGMLGWKALGSDTQAMLTKVAEHFGGFASEEVVQVPSVAARAREDQIGFAWIDAARPRLTLPQAEAGAERINIWERLKDLLLGARNREYTHEGLSEVVEHLDEILALMNEPRMGLGPEIEK